MLGTGINHLNGSIMKKTVLILALVFATVGTLVAQEVAQLQTMELLILAVVVVELQIYREHLFIQLAVQVLL